MTAVGLRAAVPQQLFLSVAVRASAALCRLVRRGPARARRRRPTRRPKTELTVFGGATSARWIGRLHRASSFRRFGMNTTGHGHLSRALLAAAWRCLAVRKQTGVAVSAAVPLGRSGHTGLELALARAPVCAELGLLVEPQHSRA